MQLKIRFSHLGLVESDHGVLKMHINIHVVEVDAWIVYLGAGFFLCPMGDGEDSKKKNIARTIEMENLSLDISANSRLSRDLLQRFMGTASEYEEAVKEEEDEEIELNLGLSLGGRFGVDKSSKKLVRSSSVASCLPVVRDDNDVVAPAPVLYSGLTRTSSLPVETEEEWRKRKELQTLRRMEAKRRRSEKQRNLRSDKEGGGSGGGTLSLEERKEIEVNLRERLDREKSLSKRAGSSLRSQFGLSSWAAAAASQAILRSGNDAALGKGKGSYVGSSGGIQGLGQPASQGSVESKGGSSSSMSDLESKTLQGSSSELSPASIQSLQEGGSQELGSSGTKTREQTSRMTGSETDSPSKRPEASRTRGKEVGTNSMEDMPCVFTKGDGPNGKRVDGILYKYGKGEEVRIMCVCHGSFHSPAEFVKHAGGTDVDHPLKHIVVNPNSSSLL
ncbi:Ninja-family protein AFP2 [Sesamum angolense]|uniref:Ninja-family protein n=1 Tax=Sesamum angolense TaxID=2727404 RepID=A0AAE1T6M6_9LAMI|nr:Ninja-family protein AFP2 [Sesamum angolense]